MPSISVPAAILGSAAISGGMGLIGGGMQAGAAKDAAQLQYQAAQQAAAQQWAMFQQMQGNLAPYMMTGQNAMNNLSMLTGNSPMVSPEVAQWQQQLKAAQSALAGLNAGAPSGGAGAGTGAGGSAGATTGQFGQYSGPMTPGVQAAMAAGGSGVPGQGNPDTPVLEGIGKAALLGPAGLFWNTKPNNSQIQDIAGALFQGLPLSDAEWAEAGYGPGGAALPGQGTGGNPLMPNIGLQNPTGAAAGPGGAAVPAGPGGAAAPGTPGAMPTDAAGLQQLITQLQGKINQANFSATPGNPLTAPLTRPFQPTMAELEATPGYQFTLNQGLKATQNAATAMGLGQSGPALAGAADYAAGLASQTYQQQFNNYWANNQNLYNMVSGLASLGQSSAAGVGNAGIQTAGAVGNLLTGGAAALGAGQVGAANAWAGGLNNLAGAGGNAALLLAMRNNGLFGATPAASTTLPAVGAGNDASYMGASGYAYA